MPLSSVIVLMFVLGWLAWLPGFWWRDLAGPFVLLGQLAPLVAVLVVLVLRGDRLPVFFANTLVWRVHIAWYLLAWAAPPLLAVVALGYFELVPLDDLLRFLPQLPILMSIGLVLTPLWMSVGTLASEIAFRGFLLPALLKRYTTLQATLFVGSVWGLWHLPLHLLGQPGLNDEALVLSSLAVIGQHICLSFILTWLYRHTNGSVLLSALLVMSLTFTDVRILNGVFDITSLVSWYPWALANVLLVIAGLLVAAFGPRLTRQRLLTEEDRLLSQMQDENDGRPPSQTRGTPPQKPVITPQHPFA